jgi:hypothetical protein
MRTHVAALAMSLLLACAARAADSSPVVGQFPDTANNQHVYLFTLKKNGISLRMSPADFCSRMGYGEAVFPQQRDNDPVGREDGKTIKGELDWVICRFAGR